MGPGGQSSVVGSLCLFGVGGLKSTPPNLGPPGAGIVNGELGVATVGVEVGGGGETGF